MVKYWNNLNCSIKKFPNPHPVYSITIPTHFIEKAKWKKKDIIGFTLFNEGGTKGNSLELTNLTQEKKPYANLFFIKNGINFAQFVKKITRKNFQNLSPSTKNLLMTKMKKEYDEKNPFKGEKIKNKKIITKKQFIQNKIKLLKKEKIKIGREILQNKIIVEKRYEMEIKEQEELLR